MTPKNKILNAKADLRKHRRAAGKGIFLAALLGCALTARAAFVYETPTEFLTSGDFNADGIPDVLVLDRLTGNARVGYQSPAGTLTWSAPLATGAENISGCGVEKFLLMDRDSLALTAPYLNRINLVDLSNTNSVPLPTTITTAGIGPHSIVGLNSPTVPPPSPLPYLLVGSSFNSAPAERLDFLFYFTGPVFFGLFNETGPFERPNAMDLNTNTATFAVGLVRGETNDTLHVWQFTNAPSVIGVLSNLPSGSDYVFGRFNNEALPRFWFYVPGDTNVTIRSLVTNGTGFGFGTTTTIALTQAVEQIYVVGASNDGSAILRFGDGIQGARLPGGVPSLAPKYSAGAGNEFTGIAALNNGRFALLSAPTGTVTSVHAQVMTFNGTNYTQVSSNNLSAVTTHTTRATVWLFQAEPFVSPSPNFLGSVNAPDWSGNVSGLPGSLSARVETDGGTTSGLGSPATNNLGTPPAGAAFGLPDQYRDDISLFSYSTAHPAEGGDVFISPPPGIYDGPVTITLTKQSALLIVSYRINPTDAWQMYSTPFTLTHDATIQFYARGPGGPAPPRSPLHFATYTLGATGETPPDFIALPGSEDTNAPPDVVTNVLQLSASGTVFYSRHTALAELQGFQGPSPYLSFADSPFNATGFDYFYLENFEDGVFNVSGATPSAGWAVAGPAGSVDSVDADDGTINGNSTGGHSYYSGGSQTNLTITFNAAALGGHLPTHAGIVWTDVGAVLSGTIAHGNVTFSARDANGVSLGSFTAVNQGDNNIVNGTAEDRFFGIVNRGGISSISIAMTNSVDWEVDHVQYGYLNDAGFDDAIWAINLDGSGETFITDGAHPRVTRDGQWMAFLREGQYSSQGNLWVKNLQTGVETRFFTNTDTIVGFDWNWPQPELVFDNNCVLLRKPLNGPVTQLPLALTPECFNGAPVVNPVTGRLAFQNVNPGAVEGVYITPPDWSTRTHLTEPTTLRWRWPAWSQDGTRLAMADRTSSAFINTGVNLWTTAADGSNPKQITAFSGQDGFPNGAIWTPHANALVGAGVIGGTNGLWIIPLAADGSGCHCPPLRLPTSPGPDIDFAGSIINAPVALVAKPGLFIRAEPNAVVVYWSTSYDGFALESAASLNGPAAWQPITGPYFLAGNYYEYHESKAALQVNKYFRLRYPGVLALTPPEPELSVHIEPAGASPRAVLNWPTNYVGYTLESTTNLSPPVVWTPLNIPFVITNGVLEYRPTNAITRPREFFRLRWP